MRALYYDGSGAVEWRSDPAPTIAAATDALVRPIAVTTCDVDQAILRGSVPGTQQPYPIGHEGIGEVVETGDAVSEIVPGEVVVIPYHISCGQCDRCTRGVPLYCRATSGDGLAVYGMPVGPVYGGMFSELIRVPFAGHSLLPLPPNVTPLQAVSAGDNLTDAWRAVVPHLRAQPGADVLIMSTSRTGLLAADIASACGARRVRYVDRDPTRLELAAGIGVETSTLEDFQADEHEYEITVNASDSKTALRNAILATAPGGHCESMAFHFADVPMPLLAMHLRCVNFRTSLCNARPHIPAVLELLSSGRIHPELIQTDLLAFEDAAESLLGAGTKPVFVQEPASD
jgi:threonine dehydrogenase-like Zn-dependent dehydrogenase